MIDYELISMIVAGECSSEDLQDFVKALDKKELDKNNAFNKYFSAKAVNSIFKKFESRKIDVSYLANWVCAYDWIISASMKTDENSPVTGRDILQWQVMDCLDSLSFITDEKWEKKYIDADRILLNAVYELYEDYDDLTFCYAHTLEFCGNDNEREIEENDDIIFLVVNDSKKRFATFYTNFPFREMKVQMQFLSEKTLLERISKLEKLGYLNMLKLSF